MAIARRGRICIVLAAIALAPAGCGQRAGSHPGALPADYVPVRIGRGIRFRLPAVSDRVARRVPVAGMRCTRIHPRFYGVHLELYADRLVLPVPAGIGVAPPQRRSGAYVLGGRCSYSVRTLEPTGIFLVDSGRTPSLAALFAVWRQPLTEGTLATFHGRVAAFVGGLRWPAAPGAIPLRRHAEIVLEVGGAVRPHPAYDFPPGV